MFHNLNFFILLCLLTACSGEHKLDTPQDIEDKKAQRQGKIFGDIVFRFPSQEAPKDKDTQEKTQK